MPLPLLSTKSHRRVTKSLVCVQYLSHPATSPPIPAEDFLYCDLQSINKSSVTFRQHSCMVTVTGLAPPDWLGDYVAQTCICNLLHPNHITSYFLEQTDYFFTYYTETRSSVSLPLTNITNLEHCWRSREMENVLNYLNQCGCFCCSLSWCILYKSISELEKYFHFILSSHLLFTITYQGQDSVWFYPSGPRT